MIKKDIFGYLEMKKFEKTLEILDNEGLRLENWGFGERDFGASNVLKVLFSWRT